VKVLRSISHILESPVVTIAFLFKRNLISETFHPVEKNPYLFLTLMVSIYISLLVDVSNTQQVPLSVPTTNHSPSKEKLRAVIELLISTQSITDLCLILHIRVILSKLPVANKSSLPGLNETEVTNEGIENI